MRPRQAGAKSSGQRVRGSYPSRGGGHRQAVAEITPLLDRVHAGHSLATDDVALVGKLPADPEETKDDIQDTFNMIEWWTKDGMMEAIDWFEAEEWEGESVTSSSTNAELRAMVAPLTRQANEASGSMIYNVCYALDYRWGQLQDAEDA